MKLENGGSPISANGDYEIDATQGDTLLIDVDGTFNGASVLLNFKSVAGNSRPVRDADGAQVGGTDWWVGKSDVPRSGTLILSVTGVAAGTSIRVGWTTLARGPQKVVAGGLAAA